MTLFHLTMDQGKRYGSSRLANVSWHAHGVGLTLIFRNVICCSLWNETECSWGFSNTSISSTSLYSQGTFSSLCIDAMKQCCIVKRLVSNNAHTKGCLAYNEASVGGWNLLRSEPPNQERLPTGEALSWGQGRVRKFRCLGNPWAPRNLVWGQGAWVKEVCICIPIKEGNMSDQLCSIL